MEPMTWLHDNTTETQNALMEMKDIILSRINSAEDAESLRRAHADLYLVSRLWESLDYGYKAVELREAVRIRARALIKSEDEYLSGCRKNCKTRVSTVRNINQLIAFRDS